jgi:hypothetical protein
MSERGRNKFSNDAAGVCLTVHRPALRDAVMLASRVARVPPRPVAREDGDGKDMPPVLIFALTYWLIRLLTKAARRYFPPFAAREAGSRMMTLKLKATPIVVRKTLCTACVFSQVRGYEKHEELVLCGYAFALPEILFAVRECTDFRAEREVTLALAGVPEN